MGTPQGGNQGNKLPNLLSFPSGLLRVSPRLKLARNQRVRMPVDAKHSGAKYLGQRWAWNWTGRWKVSSTSDNPATLGSSALGPHTGKLYFKERSQCGGCWRIIQRAFINAVAWDPLQRLIQYVLKCVHLSPRQDHGCRWCLGEVTAGSSSERMRRTRQGRRKSQHRCALLRSLLSQ